jgi:hypothetical protein
MHGQPVHRASGQQQFRMGADGHADVSQVRVIGGVEGLETGRVDLGRATAAQEAVAETQADLRHGSQGDDHERRDQIVPAVAAHPAKRDLRPRQNHGLGQAFKHERQGRGRVGHGVRAVDDDEPIEFVVFVGDVASDGQPVARTHVGGIEQGRVLADDVFRHFGAGKIRHGGHDAAEVSRFRGIALRSGLHADGPAGVEDADPFFHVALQAVSFQWMNSMISSCSFLPAPRIIMGSPKQKRAGISGRMQP